MRGLVLVAAGVLLAPMVPAQESPRVLEVTLADLDEDSLDFLIGWERWKGDILDIASDGYARFTFVPLLAVEPGLPARARFSGQIFAAAERGATLRQPRPQSLPKSRPVRTARAPRGRTSDRGRPRPPRGVAPIGRFPRSAAPAPRTAGRTPARNPKGLGAAVGRGGGRGDATGASTGRAPTGRAKPRSPGAKPRGPGARSRSGSEPRNPGNRIPRRHR